jgi:hypothetical protein
VTDAAGEPRPGPLVREALDLFGEYQRTGGKPLITGAVQTFRAALTAAGRYGVPDIAAYHNNLAYALHELAEATGDEAAQAEAVRWHRAAVATTERNDPAMAGYLCTLASGLCALYGYAGQAELLSEAFAAATEAVSLPEAEPGPAIRYAVLAGVLGKLHERKADPALLTELIAAYRQAAGHAEQAGDPSVAAHWNSLGGWLSELYESTGDTGALADAIWFARKAVAAASGDTHLKYLSSLGDTLRLRFERTGDLDALTESVAAGRTAVAGTWPGNTDLPRRANNLAGALSCRYERLGDTAALAEALTTARQAVASATPDAERRGGYLNNLQVALELDWERTGTLATLSESVRVSRESVAAAPPGHRLRALCLGALASATSALYERTGDDELLAESVQARRDALAAVPADHSDHALYLHNLGQALGALAARTGDPAVLGEAVQLARAAVAATPSDDPALAMRLAGLASLLDDLAERTGDAGPLSEAVSTARAALAVVSADDPSRAPLLEDLGAILTSLYGHTRNSALLKEAVQARREALATTPEGHLSRIGCLINLASSVQALATRADDGAATEEAARLVTDALAALPQDHPDRALCLHKLARFYRARARRSAESTDGYLDEAIGFARQSVAVTPTDHPDRMTRFASLADLLLLRSQDGREPAALAEALQLARQALSAVPPGDPDYGRRRNLLGMVQFNRHRAAARTGGDNAAAAEAWQCFYDAARQPLASVRLRVNAYLRAAEFAGEAGRTPAEALACIEAAVGLLPGVLPGELDRPDQEYEIGSVSYLASDAAQAAVTAGRPDRAVELLEQTRGVLVAEELDRRAGHDHRAPLTMSELSAVAAGGPVVYLYTGELRCDALILAAPVRDGAGQVRHVPLGLSAAEVWERAGRLSTLVGLEPGERPDTAEVAVQREVLAIIDWLRERVTGPVLAALDYDRPPDGEHSRPRVWWCPVGVFAFFPLHAACLEEVASSYAFSARSLRNARSQPPPAAEQASAPLVVAVPSAPGVPPLPGASLEAEAIARLFLRTVRLERPTAKAVLAALPGHPVAHFACHGSMDPDEPGRSQLFLDDHAAAPLTVGDIGELRLAGGLAFLSACETAVTTSGLANEAVHLTGAFQLAGYQHVVGTLWPVADLASVRLARDFYAALTVPGAPGTIDVSRAATALRDATRRLRDRYPHWPTFWAGHIHTGP